MKAKRKYRLRLAAVIQVALCFWLWAKIEMALPTTEWIQALITFCLWSLFNYNVVMKKLRLSASQKRSLITGIRMWYVLITELYQKIAGKSRRRV